MAKKISTKDILIPRNFENLKEGAPENNISLKDRVRAWLFSWGFDAFPSECCNTCDCGYEVGGIDFTDPVPISSIVVDGVTVTMGGWTVDNQGQLAALLSTLGYGQFTVNPETLIMCPPGGHTFGTIGLNDGTITELAIACPPTEFD